MHKLKDMAEDTKLPVEYTDKELSLFRSFVNQMRDTMPNTLDICPVYEALCDALRDKLVLVHPLKSGDKVLWSGSWGRDIPKEATIECFEDKHGNEINMTSWETLDQDIGGVFLTNRKWAYPYQIKPLNTNQ